MPISARFLLATLVLFAASCSKSGSAVNPPANSTQVTVTIAFADGHTYTSTDYSVPDTTIGRRWPFIIDGRVDTTNPVIWLNDNNVDNGWEYYTYGITGMTKGKTYFLVFSTPTYYNNTNIAESWDPNVYNPTLGWTLAQGSYFTFEGSTYNLRQLTVTTAIADSSKNNPTSGSFSVSLIADSVFTAGSRKVYTAGPIQISGTFKNLNIYP